MKWLLVVVLVAGLGSFAAADECPPVDDPECKVSMACCTYKYCGSGWDLRRLKVPGCASAAWTAKPSPEQCTRMREWLSYEERLLASYANAKLVVAGVRQGWTIKRYHDEVDANTPAVSGGPPRVAGTLMGTNGRTCKIEEEAAGCAWLKSKGLPDVACDIARQHEEVHVVQCTAWKGGSKSIVDASIREIYAHLLQIVSMYRWLEASCRL